MLNVTGTGREVDAINVGVDRRLNTLNDARHVLSISLCMRYFTNVPAVENIRECVIEGLLTRTNHEITRSEIFCESEIGNREGRGVRWRIRFVSTDCDGLKGTTLGKV